MSSLNLALATVIEKMLNQVIALDSDVLHKAQPLAGKTICLSLTDWELEFWLAFNESPIAGQPIVAVHSRLEHSANVTLSGSSFAFFNMAQQQRGGDAFFTGELHFSGEINTAQTFQAFWQQLDLDWEEALSKYTGDIFAHQAGRSLKQFHQFAKKSFFTFKQNSQEYMTEELLLTPTVSEADTLFSEIDELKSDVSRLEARISVLTNKMSS